MGWGPQPGGRDRWRTLRCAPSLGDVNTLDTHLTIGGVRYAPCAYLVADDINPSTGAWASRHDATKTLSVTGSGTSPTYQNESAIANAAVHYAGGTNPFHVAADTTWGQITTGDGAVEFLFWLDPAGTPGTHVIASTQAASGVGLLLYSASGTPIVRVADADTNAEAYYGAIAAGNGLCHVFAIVDRSDFIHLWVNGLYGTAASLASVTGDVTGPNPLRVGTWQNGIVGITGSLLHLGIWDLPANPWPGAATNQAIGGAIAAERFGRICGVDDRMHATRSMTRSATAYVDRYVSSTERRLFPVSAGWPRQVEREDANGVRRVGYLAEGQGTNEFTYSEDLSNAAWVKTRCTIASNAIAGPRGDTTADGIIASADADTHYITQSLASSAAQHVASFWLKQGNKAWCKIASPSVANAYAYFDLSGGSVGSFGAGCSSTGIQPWGNGYYRCWIEYAGGAAAHDHQIFTCDADSDDTFTGDAATVNLYVWGAQHEKDGRVAPTSYIPTVAAAATRNADVLYFERTGMGASMGRMEALVYGETTRDRTLVGTIASLSASSSATANITLRQNTSGDNVEVEVQDGSEQAKVEGTTDASDGKWHLVRAQWRTNRVALSLDGAVEGSPDTTCTIPANLNRVHVGCTVGGADHFSGVISALRIEERDL